MARLLIIEDNLRLAHMIADGLAQHGHRCDMVHDLASADAALDAGYFDALILDLGLPDGNGLDLLRSRKGSSEPPTLILTARAALEDRIMGLDAGADDYLVKPFALDELAARLRALLRRPGPRASNVMRVGSIAYDMQQRTATIDQHPLTLTRREADMLELFMRHAGQVVRRELIEGTLYSFDDAVTPNAIEATVSRLRRKLDDGGALGQLHTVRGVGYLLKDAA